jgi:hypothetical protein
MPERLRQIFKTGVKKILIVFLRSLKSGRSIDTASLDALVFSLQNQAIAENEKIANSTFRRARVENLQPLQSLLEEKDRVMKFVFNQYRFKINQSKAGLLNIGRRGQDIIRELSLKTIEEGFVGGNPVALARDRILKEIKDRGIDTPRLNNLIKRQKDLTKALNIAKRSGIITDGIRKELASIKAETMKAFKEVGDNVPVFSRDGRPKFLLHVFPYEGRFMEFDVENYADLVARTTTREAGNVAGAAKAEKLGTRLVKFNFIGKNYKALKDPCEFIDGGTYSTEEKGTVIAGKFFPYWKDGFIGFYLTAHPNCQHRLRPVSEKLAPRLTPGKVAKKEAA